MNSYSQPQISIHEIMNEMTEKLPSGDAKPFTISFWTCNLEKRTGGKLIKYDRAVRRFVKADAKALNLIGVEPIGVPNAHVTTVHLPLIQEFNGKLATL